MKRSWQLLTLTFGLFVAANAFAISITDRWPADENLFVSVTEDTANQVLTINETYGEDEFIAYPSHDGYAVVEQSAGQTKWFDTIFDLTGVSGSWTFQFEVTNATPWDWSDYHFVFFSGNDFTTPLEVWDGNVHTSILFGWANTVIFENTDVSANELQFWEPSTHATTNTATYKLFLDLDKLPANTTNIGIRQIATTSLPVIGTFPLILLGALGLAWQRRRHL